MIMDEKVEYFKLPFYKRLSSIFIDLMCVFTSFLFLLLVFSMIIPRFMNNDKELNDSLINREKIVYQSNLYVVENNKYVISYEDENITKGFEYTNNLETYLKNKKESELFVYENGKYIENGSQEELDKFYKDNWNIALNFIKQREDYKYYDAIYQEIFQSYNEKLLIWPALISVIGLMLILPFVNKDGKTIGKFVFKISVSDPNLDSSNRLQIFMRQFFFVISLVTVIPFIVSLIICLFNNDGRTLHDYLSKTRLIDSKVRKILLDKRKKEENLDEEKLVF